jgi:spore germination protein
MSGKLLTQIRTSLKLPSNKVLKGIVMKQPIQTGLVIIAALGLLILGYFSWQRHQNPPLLVSPFSEEEVAALPDSPTDQKYQVYGFAPFWNFQRTTIQPELTQFAYFSLPMTPEGLLDGFNTPGPSVSKTRWKSPRLANMVDTLYPHQEFVIVFTQFSNESIEQLLSTPSSKTQLLTSIDDLLDESPYPIKGINFDIEYKGEARPELRQQYVTLMSEVKQLLERREQAGKPAVELSLCTYASAAGRSWIWDVEALEPYIDRFVVMAYDFHRSTSPVAGPVAPVFGGRSNWDSDIVVHLKEFTELIPPEKILLGIPFYGYEWETTSTDPLSAAFPGGGSTASYSRVQQLLADKVQPDLFQGWDDQALAPYVTFTQDGRAHVIHYDDQRSLGYKLDLVRDLRLAGIAIWALGYESESRELWDVIQQKLETAP